MIVSNPEYESANYEIALVDHNGNQIPNTHPWRGNDIDVALAVQCGKSSDPGICPWIELAGPELPQEEIVFHKLDAQA